MAYLNVVDAELRDELDLGGRDSWGLERLQRLQLCA